MDHDQRFERLRRHFKIGVGLFRDRPIIAKAKRKAIITAPGGEELAVPVLMVEDYAVHSVYLPAGPLGWRVEQQVIFPGSPIEPPVWDSIEIGQYEDRPIVATVLGMVLTDRMERRLEADDIAERLC